MKTFFLICLVYLLNAGTQLMAQNAPGFDFSAIKNNINKQIDSNHVPSIAIAVVKDQKIVWEESFGYSDKEQKIKSTTNTPYYIASVTKLITAIGIMKLYESGTINVDSPVNHYLKRSAISSPFWDASAATVRRLLQHTAGLVTYDRDCYPDRQNCPFNIDTTINRYGIALWKPGTLFDYSNIGYGVLGNVISDASGKSFSSFLRGEIFGPLAMRDSHVSSDGMPASGAVRYLGDPAKTRMPFRISSCPGASAVYSSVHDLALFSIFFLNPEKGIISGNSISAIQNTPVECDSSIHGMGGFRNDNYYGYTLFSSQGGTSEAQAWVQFIPSEKAAVIVLSNTGSVNCQSIVNEAFSTIIPGFKNRMALPVQNSNAKPAQPNTAIIPAEGLYRGYIHTFKQDFPFTIQFAAAGQLIANIGNKEQITISNARRRGNKLTFEMPADLNIPEDTGGIPYKLKFYLFFEGAKFYGAAITTDINNGEGPRLPFSVSLSPQ